MADTTPDSEYRIKFTTVADTTGVVASQKALDETGAGVEKVTESTGKAAKGFTRMVEEAGTMREAQRLSMGLFDTFEGGGRTIQGAAEMMRFFLLTAVDINPVLLAASVIGAGLVAAMARGEKASGETKDAMKGDLEETGGAVDTFKENYIAALQSVLAAQKDNETADNHQIDALNEKLRLTNELMKVEESAAIEKVRHQYLIGDAAATTDKERQRNKDQFEAAEKDIKGKSTVNSAEVALRFKTEDVTASQRSLADAQASAAENKRRIDEAQDKSADAKNWLALNGVQLDKDGKLTIQIDGETKDFVKTWQDRIDAAQKTLNDDRAVFDVAGVPHTRASPEYIKDEEARLQKVQQDLLDAKTAAQNAPLYDAAVKELGPKVQSATEQIDTQRTKIESLQSDVETLKQALVVAQKNAADDALAAQNAKALADQAQAAADAKTAYNVREAQRYADKKAAGDVEADPNATPDQKAAAKARGESIDATGFQDQLDNAAALKLSQAEVIKLRADLRSAQARAVSDLSGGQNKDASADNHELHEAVDLATQQFKAISGKSAVEAFTKMSAGLDDAARGSLLIADLAKATDAKTTELRQRLIQAENAINSLKNNHHS